MDLDERRRHYEGLLMQAFAESIGSDVAVVELKPPNDGFFARAWFTSHDDAERIATVNLGPEWCEAVFPMEPRNLGIFIADDFEDNDQYTTDRLRDDLLAPIRAYLLGGGRIEWRRNILGRRRKRMRIAAGGLEWVAR